MRAILLSTFLLLPGVALAEASHTWGAPIKSRGTGPCEAMLRLEDPGAGLFASVEVYNGLIVGGGSVALTFPLEIDGFEVRVDYLSEDSEIPDTVVVTPPPGYMADPAELVLREGERSTILIRPIPLS